MKDKKLAPFFYLIFFSSFFRELELVRIALLGPNSSF